MKINNIKSFNKQYNIFKRLLLLGSVNEPIIYIKVTDKLELYGVNSLVRFRLIWEDVETNEEWSCGVYTPVFDVLKNAKNPELSLNGQLITIEDIFKAEFGIASENHPEDEIKKPEQVHEFPELLELTKLTCDKFPIISIRDGIFLSTDTYRIAVYDSRLDVLDAGIDPSVLIMNPTHFGVSDYIWLSNGFIEANLAYKEPYPKEIYETALQTKIISWFEIDTEELKVVLENINLVGSKQVEGVHAVISLFEEQLVIKSDDNASGRISQRSFVKSSGTINQEIAVQHLLGYLPKEDLTKVELIKLNSPQRGEMEMLQIRQDNYTYIILGMV